MQALATIAAALVAVLHATMIVDLAVRSIRAIFGSK